MSWVIARHLIKSGNNNVKYRIGNFNKWSSTLFQRRKKLAQEARSSPKHNCIITEYITRLDRYVSCKMVWRENITRIQQAKLSSLGENAQIDNLLCCMCPAKKWRSNFEFHQTLGRSLACHILSEMSPTKSLSVLEKYDSKSIISKYISKKTQYTSINGYLVFVSNNSLEIHVRKEATKRLTYQRRVMFQSRKELKIMKKNYLNKSLKKYS